jgi:tellurite resistance protein TerC
LSVILIFIGLKMLVSNFIAIPTVIALATVAGVLLLSVISSLLFPKREVKPET